MSCAHSLRTGVLRFRVVVLVGLVIPWAVAPAMAGQADDALAPGSFARAVTREATRLAAVQPVGRPPESDWSRVRRLAPGSEIILTVKGSPPGAQRTVVAARDSDLTVLNVSEPALPAAARDVLRGVALRHSGYFAAAQQGRQIALGKNVRIGPDGVFVSDQKVADLGLIVEAITRDDVVEITTRQRGRGVWGHLGQVGGSLVGAMAGGLAGGFVSGGLCHSPAVGPDPCDSGAFLQGLVVGEIAGAIVGGAYGSHASKRVTEDVIYHAW